MTACYSAVCSQFAPSVRGGRALAGGGFVGSTKSPLPRAARLELAVYIVTTVFPRNMSVGTATVTYGTLYLLLPSLQPPTLADRLYDACMMHSSCPPLFLACRGES